MVIDGADEADLLRPAQEAFEAPDGNIPRDGSGPGLGQLPVAHHVAGDVFVVRVAASVPRQQIRPGDLRLVDGLEIELPVFEIPLFVLPGIVRIFDAAKIVFFQLAHGVGDVGLFFQAPFHGLEAAICYGRGHNLRAGV